MPIRVGTRFGDYEVSSSLGSGGMGEVYRARDTNLKRDVALKTLPPAVANDADRLARFQREAEVLASLNHPNIAHIYGLERSEATTALAMELIEGPTLEDRIAEGRIPVEEALRIATQIADALEAAHERGIVHRDLKPSNIKLRPDGVVKVLDFGIAKALDTGATTGPGPAAVTTPAMTEAGFVLGTAAYMSPEQARGKAVDRRTDIWAFGCVLYEMLVGKPAFLGEDVTTTLAMVLQGSADLSALPPGVSASVRRTLELCLEKDARKRIGDMGDMKLALAGTFTVDALAQPLWRRALSFAATLLLGVFLAGIYFAHIATQRVSSEQPVDSAPAHVSRFVITPPATAPLANEGDLDLTISPDGQRIAYWAVKPDSGNLELYVRELDALEARAIPGTEQRLAGLGVPRNLFFAYDGKSIGYQTSEGGIVAAAIDGRPPVKIANKVTPAFLGGWWSADNTLIFSSVLRLERVSAAGGGVSEPLMPARQAGGVAAPVLLPGGHAVLFHAAGDSDGDRVDVLDLDTGQEKTLVKGGSNPAYVDTGHIVFARGDTLMAVPFKASELAVTGDPVALVQGIRRTPGGATDFAVSANGTLVYVPGSEEETSTTAIVWVDKTGKVLGRAVPDLIPNAREPRLSPDGKRLLLVTGQDSEGQLWSYDLSGRPPIPLSLQGNNDYPIWSPDGKQVAFLAGGNAVMLAADGSERVPRMLRAAFLLPQFWSQTGELILAAPGGHIVATPPAPTGAMRDVIATSESVEFYAVLSPDGRWLAYISNRTGQTEVWVQAYPDGVPMRVSNSGGIEPLWSLDGQELFYRRGDAMMAVAVETGTEFSFAAPKQLFSGPYKQRQYLTGRMYDVARDGRFLMILPGDEKRAVPPGTIVVVQNFSEELKQRVRPSSK